MSDFQPASQQDLAGVGYGDLGLSFSAKDITGLVEAGSALAQVGITAASAGSARKSQQEHEKKMTKDYQTLEKLKTKTASAQGTVSSAQATVQDLATKKTLYIVGGGVAGVLVLAVTGYLLFRQPKKHKKSKKSEEEEE